jgi:hypothetical protein
LLTGGDRDSFTLNVNPTSDDDGDAAVVSIVPESTHLSNPAIILSSKFPTTTIAESDSEFETEDTLEEGDEDLVALDEELTALAEEAAEGKDVMSPGDRDVT